MGKRDKQSPDQADLFYQPVYASRQASDRIECLDFASRLARDMSLALRQCPYDRHEVAARMAQALGQAEFSKAMLDAYTSEAKETHQISLLRFKAFVRATAQYWLWDAVVADDGLTMLQGFENKSKGWAGGTIYDPKKGKTYASRLKRLDDGVLEVKGCIGPLCQTQQWAPVADAAATSGTEG